MTPKCRRRARKKDEPLTLFKLRRCSDSGPDEPPEDIEAAFHGWDWCSDEWDCCAQAGQKELRPRNTDPAWNKWNFWKKSTSTNSLDETWVENLQLDDVEDGKETSEATIQSDWGTIFHCKEELKECDRASAVKSQWQEESSAPCDHDPGAECGQDTRGEGDTLCSFSYESQCASVGEENRDNCRRVVDNSVSLTQSYACGV